MFRWDQSRWAVAALALLSLALWGCAAGGASGWLGWLAMLGLVGTLAACTDGSSAADAGIGDGGSWEPCCVSGKITTCFCEEGVACNYGWFDDCGGGVCAEPGESCPGDPDGADGTDSAADSVAGDATDGMLGEVDGGGSWDPCCQDGVVTTCFCPAQAVCNYGWYNDCGGGTCVFIDESCPGDVDASDAGDSTDSTDAGGTWESCCLDGQIDLCYCPAGAACNYGWYTDCGDGTCTPDPGGVCPEPDSIGPDATDPDVTDATDAADVADITDAEAGTWESCCLDGKVSTCFCPEGWECNYGWYVGCDDGTCMSDPSQSCPDTSTDPVDAGIAPDA